MSLVNLGKMDLLERHETDGRQVCDLLAAMERSLADAKVEAISVDTFRVKRNAIDYTGEMIDEASLEECIVAADRLRAAIIQWLEANRPDLVA